MRRGRLVCGYRRSRKADPRMLARGFERLAAEVETIKKQVQRQRGAVRGLGGQAARHIQTAVRGLDNAAEALDALAYEVGES